MRCIFCGAPNSKVINSRPVEDGRTIRRRRECSACGKRFTTFEVIQVLPVAVHKKNGSVEEFDSEKLRCAISRACPACEQADERIEELVVRIEKKICDGQRTDVSSEEIGELVLIELKYLDQMAFVRFASMLCPCAEISEFMIQLEDLVRKLDGHS